ncbi:hypothetical protein [Actinoplanes sp. NPDC051859]|uniref:hypothetical protein n=1 Tax=Actinoplanes sp. NPDC051859 TaxID=3363909 RepID=UPI003795FA4F
MTMFAKLADKMLGMAVPRTQAAAGCAPDNECWMYQQPGTCKCMRTFMAHGQCRTEIYFRRGCY